MFLYYATTITIALQKRDPRNPGYLKCHKARWNLCWTHFYIFLCISLGEKKDLATWNQNFCRPMTIATSKLFFTGCIDMVSPHAVWVSLWLSTPANITWNLDPIVNRFAYLHQHRQRLPAAVQGSQVRET